MAIVVVNYGSHALIEKNLVPVRLDPTRVRVIIVDNFSTAAERAAIRALVDAQGWTLVCSEHNRGFGAGVNAGISAASELGCVTYLLLNPDAAIAAEVVRELREHSLREPLALICPRIETPRGDIEFQGAELLLSSGRIRGLKTIPADAGAAVHLEGGPAATRKGWLTGACMVIHRDLLDRVGGFNESYFLYWEDVDLSYRCEQAGGALVLRQDLVALHDEGGTQGARRGRAKSNGYYFFNCRNRLRFAANVLSRAETLRWIVRTPAVSWEILKRGGRRQLIQSPKPLIAAVAGSVAGIGYALASLSPWATRSPLTGYVESVPDRTSRSIVLAHPSAELYGSDRVMLESVQALTSDGWDVVVALPSHGPLVAEINKRGATVEICRTPVLRKSALRPKGFLVLLADSIAGLVPAIRLIRRSGTDGVYVNTITIPSWLILGRLLRRPVVCHVHEAEQSASRLLRRVMCAPVLCADRIILNSKFSLGVLTDSVPRAQARCTIVYNGIPGPPDVSPARADISAGPLRLLFIGRLSPRKGPQVALATLRELTARGVSAQLSLLGSVFEGYEWFEEELRADVSKNGLDGRVKFLGFKPDVWPVLAECDVVLVPSVVDEPFGNTAVEAVLAARPLVVSTTSGLREAAAGYSSAQAVDPTSAQLWATACERVLSGWDEYRQAALRDAVIASERHSPERYRSLVSEIVSAVARKRVTRG